MCDPKAQPDPCAPYGLVCTLQGATSQSGTCQPPTELQPCQASVGCASSDLTCTSVGTGSYCLRNCTTTADCPAPFSSCQPHGGSNLCLFNLCGPGTANGTDDYGPCQATVTGDGQCLPAPNGDGGTLASCWQTGPQASQAQCSTLRASAGASSQLCAAGSACVPGQPGSQSGICEPICAGAAPFGADGGPGCDAADFCATNQTFDFGVCLQSCTGSLFSSNCPSGKYCVQISSTQKGCAP